jgi:heme/copper-type cytochrome/quinol oxidase subunit 3
VSKAGFSVPWAVAVAVAFAFGPLVGTAAASHIEPGKHVATSGSSSSVLAFTGINTSLLLLVGTALICAGLSLRRWSTRSTRG